MIKDYLAIHGRSCPPPTRNFPEKCLHEFKTSCYTKLYKRKTTVWRQIYLHEAQDVKMPLLLKEPAQKHCSALLIKWHRKAVCVYLLLREVGCALRTKATCNGAFSHPLAQARSGTALRRTRSIFSISGRRRGQSRGLRSDCCTVWIAGKTTHLVTTKSSEEAQSSKGSYGRKRCIKARARMAWVTACTPMGSLVSS